MTRTIARVLAQLVCAAVGVLAVFGLVPPDLEHRLAEPLERLFGFALLAGALLGPFITPHVRRAWGHLRRRGRQEG